MSRIREAAILDQPATRLAGFDLAAYWERSAAEFRDKLPRYYATFRASREVMQWVRYRGWRLEEETADTADGQSVRVRLRFDAEEEALQFALSFGGQIEVFEPPELRAKVLAGAQAIVERYGDVYVAHASAPAALRAVSSLGKRSPGRGAGFSLQRDFSPAFSIISRLVLWRACRCRLQPTVPAPRAC